MAVKTPKSSRRVLPNMNADAVKQPDLCAPLTYKDHSVKVIVTEPIESKSKHRHLFMPFFHTEMLSGDVTNEETKEKTPFSMSVAINGSALYFQRGKKWYYIKTEPLIAAILELDNN